MIEERLASYGWDAFAVAPGRPGLLPAQGPPKNRTLKVSLQTAQA